MAPPDDTVPASAEIVRLAEQALGDLAVVAIGRNEGERLVEHHMMPRLRNFDHRCGPPEQVEHILADLGRQQH